MSVIFQNITDHTHKDKYVHQKNNHNETTGYESIKSLHCIFWHTRHLWCADYDPLPMSTDEMHNIVFFDDEASIKCDVPVDNLLSVNHRGNQVSRVDVKVTDEILKPLNLP